MGDYRGRVPGACVLVLHEGKPVIRRALRLGFEPSTATDDPGTRYGFGWRIGGEMVWHSGESIGFRNVIVRWPSRRLTVIVLTNRNEPEPYRLALAIVDQLPGRVPI